jgi:hypothetical protein
MVFPQRAIRIFLFHWPQLCSQSHLSSTYKLRNGQRPGKNTWEIHLEKVSDQNLDTRSQHLHFVHLSELGITSSCSSFQKLVSVELCPVRLSSWKPLQSRYMNTSIENLRDVGITELIYQNLTMGSQM